MAKRKEDTPPAGSPAWMATFSDLMNLLLCFFVLLFSMSSVEESKLAELVAAMNDSFSVFDGGATSIGEGILISNGISQLNELDRFINSTGKAAENDAPSNDLKEEGKPPTTDEMIEAIEGEKLKDNEELAEKIEEAVNESNLADQIEISFTSQYVRLSMKGALLFSPGSAELREEAARVLEKAAVVLERYAKGTIEIEGHTDSVPHYSAKYANNEELSSARALSVFYYLLEHSNLDPVNLKHAGMGDRVPIADNSTAEGRSKNRRVEIKIYNPSV